MIYTALIIFDQAHPIIIEVTLKLSQICIGMQKISSFHPLILEMQQILECYDLKGHTHF